MYIDVVRNRALAVQRATIKSWLVAVVWAFSSIAGGLAKAEDSPPAESIPADSAADLVPKESPATESAPAASPPTASTPTQPTPAVVQPTTVQAKPIQPKALQPATVQEAPDFALRTLQDQNLRLSEFRGEVVLINFWASWCGACRQAMPSLNDMYNKYHRAGLIMLSVNVNDELRRAAAMAKSLKIAFPVLLDDQRDVGKAFRIEQMPTTLLIDRAGVIRHRYVGYNVNDEQKILAGLRELLNE